MTAPTFVTDFFAHLHGHFREIALQHYYLKLARLGGADVVGGMPNLDVPLTTAALTLQYWEHAKRVQLEEGQELKFVPIGYLNEATTFEMMVEFMDAGIFHFKLYPRNRTTKSTNGIVNYYPIIDVVRRAALYADEVHGWKIFIHFHPEHPLMDFTGRTAEFVFLVIAEMFLANTAATVVWEHGTDGECIHIWKQFAKTGRFLLTITPHHLIDNEDTTYGVVNAVCKPPYRPEPSRLALLQLFGENPLWVMLGPDGAPHDRTVKQPSDGSCCAFGSYHDPFLAEVCAHALSDILDRGEIGQMIFRNFTSRNARNHFDLPPATGQMTLAKQPFKIRRFVSAGPQVVVIPYRSGKELLYSRVKEEPIAT